MTTSSPLPRRLPLGVFLIVLASLAYFWQGRDWNISSRLMLTYALADRGTLSINGLEDHTRDRARVGPRYYSDKAPGLSLAAIPPYLLVREVIGIPPHPLDQPGPGFTHWPADYWITLATSGLATALIATLLCATAHRLGCTPRAATLIGLAYGLATPAFVYGTLAYGHQLATFCLFASLLIIAASPAEWRRKRAFHTWVAGFLAGWGVLTELQLAPVALILSALVVVAVIRHRRPPGDLVWFPLGALGPFLILLTYNYIAFGSPFRLGYFHEDIQQFRDVHSTANPLGLQTPNVSLLVPLLFSPHRGLFFYAPILLLAPLGWIRMARSNPRSPLLWTTLATSLAIFAINLAYPEWTGGWSTGPRLLVPLIPFALIPVAALVGTRRWYITSTAILATLAGAFLMFLFQGAGGRVPQDIMNPLGDFVLPLWQGTPGPSGQISPLARNIFTIAWPESATWLPPSQALTFAPLALFQMLAALLLIASAPSPTIPEAPPFDPSPRLDMPD